MTRRLEHGFVAVHAGAGYHSLETRPETLRACKEACKKAYDVLASNGNESSALEACVAATMVLEDDPVTNAGLGSNLTMDEKVECDAGLMEGCGMGFAGIGCVKNVKNPISVCKTLLEVQNGARMDGNSLVPPGLLAGEGATDFARRHGLDMVSDLDLVTKRSLGGHRKALKTVTAAEIKRDGALLDTVGVIVVDNRGRVAAACSSGGPLLKLPGRIGHAAHFGCGVWAQQIGTLGDPNFSSIASSCTGCGEYLVRTSLGKTISQRLSRENATDNVQAAADTVGRSLREDFLESSLVNGLDEKRKIAGTIALKAGMVSETDLLVDFAYGHCSSDMCLAYTVPNPKSPGIIVRSVMSVCSDSAKVIAGGGLYRLKVKAVRE